MVADKLLGLPTPLASNVPLALPQHSPEHAHKLLLHSGYHLVHHHEASLPHLPHGIGTLVFILVVVHVVAISYLVYLFSKPLPAAKPRAKRSAELRPIKCENDWLKTSGRSLPGRTNNV